VLKPGEADRLLKALAVAKKGGCLLCRKGRPMFVGLWMPTRSLGQPDGPPKPLTYALCKSCKRRPGFARCVEDHFRARAAAGLARPEAN
jgi:hypothetical protein